MLNKCVSRYEELLQELLAHASIESQGNVRERIAEMAAWLGAVGAGPKEVVEVHRVAMRRTMGKVSSRQSGNFVAEARLLVLELMGQLVLYYRDRSARLPDAAQDEEVRGDSP